jgi:hypothetical protein
MNSLKEKSFRVTFFCKLSWSADIYYIWIDRNLRLHADRNARIDIDHYECC